MNREKNKWNKENKIEKKKRTSNLGLKQRRARGGGDWGEMEMRIYWDYSRGFIPKKKLPTNQPNDQLSYQPLECRSRD